MMHTSLKKILLSAILLVVAVAARAEVNPKPFVIPELKTWTGAEGSVALSGRIVVKHSTLQKAARALAADYSEMFGRTLTVGKGKAQAGDIVFTLKKGDKQLGDEGYRLSVGRTVEVTAATPTGAFWATRTLLQISEQQADRKLPCGLTTDVPEYKLRGLLFDCGRKFFPMSYLRKLTKVMAYYKMNLLNVHLNDNGFRQFFGGDWMKTQAAFRLECDTYPGLTAKDGSYSKKEFIEFQQIAADNCVEIIPEIDVPAHSLAFTQYKPEIGSKEFGMDHLDLGNPETYKFLDALFKEYLEGENPVFQGPRVNIGTDEYSNAKKEVVEQFRSFTDHYIKLVESYGKKAALWGSLTHAKGETPVKSKDVTMLCWNNGFANPKDMKAQGYNIVSIPDWYVYIVPAAGYYYDYLNDEYLYTKWTPAVIANQTFEERDPAIEGGMFAVWNDHVGNGISVKDVHHRVFPALQTIAVKCWTGKATKLPFDEWNKQRTALSEAPGVNELARLARRPGVVLERAALIPGQQLDHEEIGYDYAVSFTLNAQQEAKGTELFRSANAVFYLSDPNEGKLGFERDGYLITFNYRPEAGKRVELKIEGTNRATRLYVDGRLKEELGPKRLRVKAEKDRFHAQVPGASPYEPIVYQDGDGINFQRTLVFPLRQIGRFKSQVVDFKVSRM